jgi:hypothetical protein
MPGYSFGRAIGASAKILYCCTRGFALSASLTYWIELLPMSARQDHDADEAARPIRGGLCEHGIAPAPTAPTLPPPHASPPVLPDSS